ncbi:MAG: Fe-S-cluster containining protein [Pseudohongiellaceae bacterium]|jgi:Fe-S-cluster containining protein
MPSYLSLLETLDAWFAQGQELAGAGVIPCKRSCSACCHGVFDISPADARLVKKGLSSVSPEVAVALRAKAADQLSQYAELLPDWRSPWDVDSLPEELFDELTERLAAAPCPALSADGSCAIYAHRPATCRMTGLAMDAGEAGRLDNECPIQEEFPGYSDLAPVPFALMHFEELAEQHDEQGRAQGACSTTVAGALSAAGAEDPCP